MAQTSFRHGDALWTKLRERAKTDLFWFAEEVLGYRDKVPMRKHAHKLMCLLATGKTGVPEIDSAPYLKLLLPRNWGKSRAVTIARTMQYLCNDPNESILLCNEKEENVKTFLKEIKWHFEANDFFRGLFPELVPTSWQDTEWSSTRITINRTQGRAEPSVFVIGVGGAIAGMHPDRIIVDDMISRDAAENARRGSWQIMEEVNRWIHTLEPLLSSKRLTGRRGVFIGTHWFFNDCYDHLEQYFGYGGESREWLVTVEVEGGRRQTLPVKRIGDLVIFKRSVREENQWSWPDKYDEDMMLRMQAEDPVFYSANMLNEPATDATATFRSDWLKPYQWLDPTTIRYTDQNGLPKAIHLGQLDTIMLVDPGGFGKTKGEDRARAALVVVGTTPTGEHLLLDCWSDRDTYVVAQQRAVAMARQYRVRKMAIEVEGQQRVFFDQLRQMLAQANLPVAVQELKTEGVAKDNRILQLESYFQRGLVYIGSGAVFTEFRTQYQQFPRSARRDLLDALAYLPRVVRPRIPGPANQGGHEDRIKRELAALYAKMGATPGRR